MQQPRGQRGKALGDAVTLGYADACAGRPRDEQRPLRQRQQTLRVANLDTGVGQRIGKSGVFGPILHGDFGIRHGPAQRQLAGQNAPHGCVHDLHRQCAIFHRSPQCPDARCLHIAAIGVGIVTAVAGNKQVASGQRRQHRPPRCAVAVHDGVHLKSITDNKAIKAQLAPQRVSNDRFGQ